MRRRSATTGLIVKALRMPREMVDVLSDLVSGTAMRTVGTNRRRVAL